MKKSLGLIIKPKSGIIMRRVLESEQLNEYQMESLTTPGATGTWPGRSGSPV